MTPDIPITLVVLLVTVGLFVSERLRLDLIAIALMVALPLLGLVTPAQAFSGLASNTVVAVIGVMILGYGLDRSGVMQRFSALIVRLAGHGERRLTAVICGAAGVVSSVLQNVGVTALFLPVLLRLSRDERIPASNLLMPMGFLVLLGGNMSMIGASSLILVNDLLTQSGQPEFALFSIAPLGLALLVAGMAYFLLAGHLVLPHQSADSAGGPERSLCDMWGLPTTVYHGVISTGSALVGTSLEESGLCERYHLHLLALRDNGEVLYAPWRHSRFGVGQELITLGHEEDVLRFGADNGLPMQPVDDRSSQILKETGYAEVVVPPRSRVIGKTMREIEMRHNLGVVPMARITGDCAEPIDLSDTELHVGDTLVVHGPWSNLVRLGELRDFVLLTPIDAALVGGKPWLATLCFAGAMGLAIVGLPLALSLLTGAVAMLLLRVVRLDEAYEAVNWSTVFLLAGLIPLGIAMKDTGAAALIATQAMRLLQGSPTWLILVGVATLATGFSLVMGHIAATVVLVPLLMLLGQQVGIEPRSLALLAALCANNSFILPTHAVNAMLMAPGGYHNADYLRAGWPLTLVSIALSAGFIWMTL